MKAAGKTASRACVGVSPWAPGSQNVPGVGPVVTSVVPRELGSYN